MSGWSHAVPAVLVAAALVTVPGAGLAWLAGLRGIPVWGLAAPLSVTLLSCSALVAGALGLPWGGLAVLAGFAVAAVPAAAIGRYAGQSRLPDPAPVRRAALAGAGVGALVAGVAVARGVRSPEAMPQTFDAVFHLNAVRYALDGGNASSLHLGGMIDPTSGRGFYPAAWHALAALVVQLSGASIPVSANAVAVCIAAVVWVSGSVFLVRQLIGPTAWTLGAAGPLSVCFAASPFLLLSYGTLWPNALGTALLPAAVAVLVTVAGLACEDRVGRVRAGLLGLLMLPGLVLAHPNTAVTLMVLAPLVAFAAVRRWAVTQPRPARRRVAGTVVVLVALTALDVWVVTASPLFALTRGTDWRARETVPQAIGEVLLAAPVMGPVSLVPAFLLVVGLVTALRGRLWWLAVSHLLLGGLYVEAAGVDSPLSQALTGPWYNDAFRLGAMLPVTGVPLAVIGGRQLARAVTARRAWHAAARGRRWLAPTLVALASLAVVVTAARGDARRVGTWYYPATDRLVGPAEQALLARLDTLVPAGQVVAGSPWNGSALGQALSHRTAAFPHMSGVWGTDRMVLAGAMSHATSDPAVCRAVRRLHVGYVIDGPSTFWLGDRRQGLYAGLHVAGAPGFQPVATGGRLTLYRVTACGRT